MKRLLLALMMLPALALAHSGQRTPHPWEKTESNTATPVTQEWWCYPHCVPGGEPGGPWQWHRRVGVAPVPTVGVKMGAEK